MSEEQIEFSVIVPWKSGNPVRESHLKNMLNCLKIQTECTAFDLIIVEQVDNANAEKAKAKLLELIPQELSSRYRYIQLQYDSLFNKSWCMNVGARQAIHNHLLFIDADSLFGEDYFKNIKYTINTASRQRNKLMVCWNYLICMPGKDNPITRFITPPLVRTMGGIWYAEKNFYFKVFGGMNENFFGYGAEDNEAYERGLFVLKINSIEYVMYTIAHQYHDWAKPSGDAVRYFDLFVANPQETINRLKKLDLGNIEKPSIIDITDLKPKEIV